MIRKTLIPAIAPASLVACRCESLKYAGTVTTASVTVLPRYASAVSFIFVKTIELISSGENVFSSPLCSTRIFGLPPSLITSNGQCFMSDCTVESSNRRPIKRFASKIEIIQIIDITVKCKPFDHFQLLHQQSLRNQLNHKLQFDFQSSVQNKITTLQSKKCTTIRDKLTFNSFKITTI